MRKYRIVTAAVMMTACATAELHSQMSMFFNRASEPTFYQDSSTQPNSSCTMPMCRTNRPYGHYGVSWRRWPEDISTYTTNPQLTPFVVPDRSGAPDAIVPDALDEAEFFPKNRKRGTKAAPPADNPGTDSNGNDDGVTEDLPSVDPTDSMLPDVPDDDFPAIDTEDSSPSSESDVFGAPEEDLIPGVGDPMDTLPNTDDGDFGTEFDDGFGDGFSDDLGNRELRRFHRDERSSEPAFDPRAEREAMLPLNGPDIVRATGAEVRSGDDLNESASPNPLRRNQLRQRPESVTHALHYDDRSILANRDSRRWSDRDYQDPRNRARGRRMDYDPRDIRPYDARQIQYREDRYIDRYPNRRDRFEAAPIGYDDIRYRGRDEFDDYRRPMQRATDSPAKSSNPLRP